MKEIGISLREARENMGVTVKEVASDLKMRPSQIENIEAGNIKAFKDIYYMKYFIRDYSKYLGLDYEDMIDDFNEYLFEYTSKISLDDIKEARKSVKAERAKEKEIASPYTIRKRTKFNYKTLIGVILVIFIICMGVLVIRNIDENRVETTNGVIAA